MYKKVIIVIISILTLSLATGCSKEENNEDRIEITDMVGDTVLINKNPQKVACVSRTTYDLLIAFGLGDKIDGAYYSIYDNSWTEIIYPSSINQYRYEYEESYETFISRGVDLVFAPEKYISDGLKKHGIPSLCVSLYGNPTFDDYVFYFADMVKLLWDDENVHHMVDNWKLKVNAAIKLIKHELDRLQITQKKVYYVRGDKNRGIGYTDTKASFTEYAYRVLGFDFAGTHLENNKPSAEEIVKYNPDIFVIGGIYQNTLIELLKEEPYKNLEAVKNNNIHTIPVGLTMFEQLGAMTPIFFYDQANKIYPEYFNFNIKKMISDTISKYFGTTLTDQQINYMLSGKDHLGNNLA